MAELCKRVLLQFIIFQDKFTETEPSEPFRHISTYNDLSQAAVNKGSARVHWHIFVTEVHIVLPINNLQSCSIIR